MRLREMRRAAGLTQEVVADRLGLSKSQYSRIERTPERLKASQLRILAAIFNVEVKDIIGEGGAGEPTPLASMGRAVRVSVIEGSRLVATERVMHWAIEVSIDALTVAMQDDSMHPRLNVGDELLVEPSAPPRPGSIVLARAPITGEHVVRVYVPLHPTDPRAPGFILRPINPNFAEIVATAATPGEIIGTVVARQEVL